jgi:hypothetical protein
MPLLNGSRSISHQDLDASNQAWKAQNIKVGEAFLKSKASQCVIWTQSGIALGVTSRMLATTGYVSPNPCTRPTWNKAWRITLIATLEGSSRRSRGFVALNGESAFTGDPS